MVGTTSVKLMRSRSMVLNTASGSNPFNMCTVPPSISEGQHLGAGDMADRCDREIARCVGDFEVGERRVGEAAILAMSAQRAFGFPGRSAGVIQRRDIVGAGQTTRTCPARVIGGR